MRRKLSAFDLVNGLIMFLITVTMIYPFWYVLCYSLSDMGMTGGNRLLLWPHGFSLDSYKVAFSSATIVRGFLVSISRSVIGPFLMLAVSSMAAFAMSKNELVGVKWIRRFMFFSMYVSAGLLPGYILIRSLGLTGTFWVYVLPGVANVFNIVLIRAYMETLPAGLEESAMIDGATYFKIFLRIVLPLCVPVIAAVTLYACVGQWNSYIDAQLYNYRNPELYPVQYILYNYIAVKAPTKEASAAAHGLITTAHSLRMSVTIITTLPILLVYPFLQKYFASGLLVGAIKA
ncbi:MAG: carbohydrate ABC transporter permease [Firmicutes bacterium]|nr:carbohydrate ABC transporter permease [Bacillota bacterium]